MNEVDPDFDFNFAVESFRAAMIDVRAKKEAWEIAQDNLTDAQEDLKKAQSFAQAVLKGIRDNLGAEIRELEDK